MSIKKIGGYIDSFFNRNRRGINYPNEKTRKKRINLEYWNANNIGDQLAPVIYRWICDKYSLDANKKTKKTKHLLTLGSLLGGGDFNATVWGSGILTASSVDSVRKKALYRKFDIRAVRGPMTRDVLLSCGYQCPEMYGDPGCLMPLIYDKPVEKKYDVSVALHLNENSKLFNNFGGVHYIDLKTKEYEFFIDEIRASKKIISSSLHGIILAESYGIPAIFLNTKGTVEDMMIKYLDWYYSTNRHEVKIAYSIEEALEMEPMEIPDLKEMQQKLMDCFPVDLWR